MCRVQAQGDCKMLHGSNAPTPRVWSPISAQHVARPDARALRASVLSLLCRYLTKKYLKKHNVRDWLRVIARCAGAKPRLVTCYTPA
jgi:Ribosomal L22e protein family